MSVLAGLIVAINYDRSDVALMSAVYRWPWRRLVVRHDFWPGFRRDLLLCKQRATATDSGRISLRPARFLCQHKSWRNGPGVLRPRPCHVCSFTYRSRLRANSSTARFNIIRHCTSRHCFRLGGPQITRDVTGP